MKERQPIVKTFSADITAGDGERAVVAVISAEVIDRDHEIVVVQGIRTKQYELNPVICWMHRADEPPIGRCKSLKRVGDKLVAKIIFAERPANHPAGAEWLPDTIFALFQAGALSAFSISFIPLEVRAASRVDLNKWGDDLYRVISKCELMEVSAVTLPANSEAVSIAVSKGLLTAEAAKRVCGVGAKSPGTTTPASTMPAPAPVKMRCAECEQEFNETEMAPVNDGRMLCNACREKPPMVTTPAAEQTPAKHVVIASVPSPQKHVKFFFISPPPTAQPQPAVSVEVMVKRSVDAAIAKKRGRVYLYT